MYHLCYASQMALPKIVFHIEGKHIEPHVQSGSYDTTINTLTCGKQTNGTRQ